jgi:hypothetical protein
MNSNVYKVYLIHIMDMNVIYSHGRNSFFEYKSFIYLTHVIGNFTGRQLWWQTAPQLPLYEFSVNWGTCILFHCVTVSIKFYSLYLKKVPEMVSFGLQTCVMPNKTCQFNEICLG